MTLVRKQRCCTTVIGSSAADRFSAWVSAKDLLLVVGVYKSGTSLATKLCARTGCREPSRETNPIERGFGIHLTRYLTRECKVLRRINEQLLIRRNSISAPANAEPMNYLLDWGRPIVLKDPRFLFTLPQWIIAARRLGRVPGVIFCHRPYDELVAAWEVAPFTRELLMRDRFQSHLALLRKQQMWTCRAGVPYLVQSLRGLRLIDAEYEVTAIESAVARGVLCDWT